MRTEIVLTADAECGKCKGSGVSEATFKAPSPLGIAIGMLDTTHHLKVLCECVQSSTTGVLDK